MSTSFTENHKSLCEMFPQLSPDVIKTALMSQHGNVEQSVTLLVNRPVEKTSIQELTAFELHGVLEKLDRRLAEIFYLNKLTGHDFFCLTSDETEKFGVRLAPYPLANLKKEAKKMFLMNQSSPADDGTTFEDYKYFDEDESKNEEDIEYVHIVTVPTMVRNAKDLSSEMIGGLSPGTSVTVKKIDGLRALITEPFKGWISTHAHNGIQILLKMKQVQLDHLLAQELQNPTVYEDETIYGQWDNSEDFLYDTSTIVQEESSSSPDKKSGLISSFKNFAFGFKNKQDTFDFVNETKKSKNETKITRKFKSSSMEESGSGEMKENSI